MAGVAFLVGTVSAVYSSVSSGQLLREQLIKRGRYIAMNLAKHSNYGLLTEDKPLLTQLIEAVLSASGAEASDIVGVMIRDANGGVLAAKHQLF